jgi:P-type E1-E2 ATPase
LVGDILRVTSGMEIPVDGLLIRGSDILCNEAAMTGESDEVKKESLDVCK